MAQQRFALCTIDEHGHATCARRTPTGFEPRDVQLDSVEKIAVGDDHACALRSDGGLLCWGANESGQALGTATPGFVEQPAHVADGCSDVTVGLRHTCAVLADGGAVCWGDDHFGQLGVERGPGGPLQVPVPELSDVQRIAAGDAHTCALTAHGQVYCWGKNDLGQLGDGDPATAPRVVAGVSGVVGLAAASSWTCVRHVTGPVACWGGRYHGVAKRVRDVPGTEGAL